MGGLEPRLLIVDDATGFRLAVAEEAKASGWFEYVRTAADGQDALEMLARMGDEHLPDLILTDLYMPRINGVELVRQVVKNPRTTEILCVMFSTDPDPIERQAAKTTGCVRFLEKPTRMQELMVLFGELARLAKAKVAARSSVLLPATVSDNSGRLAAYTC